MQNVLISHKWWKSNVKAIISMALSLVKGNKSIMHQQESNWLNGRIPQTRGIQMNLL